MPLDVAALLQARHGENYALHEKHLNHQLGRVLKTIGFDRFYVRGEGCYLFDADGEKYLDFLSGFGVYALGRSHPALKDALHQAIDLDLPNMVQMDCALLAGILAERLVEHCSDEITRVFFCNSGAEAIESAIKFSRITTRRPRILFADHAFHGLTTGALSLNGSPDFHEGFGMLLPGCDSVAFGDIEGLRRELSKGDVAAFVVEPIQGKGVYMAPAEYWKEAQELCRKHKTLLVLDEVQTGLARTGKFFCFEHWGLEPDIITVSKALSGGFIPVGAVLTSDRVFSSVFSSLEKALKHSSTFGRNQLAMVAGLATLTAFDDEGTIEHARETGLAFEAALAPLVERYEMFHEVRGKGLMIGLEFGSPESKVLRLRYSALEHLRPAITSQMLVVPLFHRHRILTQVAADNVNIIKLLPPLICGQEEIDYFVGALDDVLKDAHSGPGLLFEFGRTMAKRRDASSGQGASGSGIRASAVKGKRQRQRARRRPPSRSLHALVRLVNREMIVSGSNRTIDPGDRVVVTGAAGFIGSAVVRALLARSAHVVAVVEPGSDETNLQGLEVERQETDVRDRDSVIGVCEGARFIFHLAAMYRFWAPRAQDFYDVNVGGALNVLDAARANKCERIVYTSTVGVLGLEGAAHGTAADETCYADVAHLFGLYKRTKYVAEHEVLRAAAQGAPVSLVLPTFPLGPGDTRPTPTGKLVLDFLNGRVPAFVDTTLNVVHVDDLAGGHLLALERGLIGRSYIIGGENVAMGAMLAELARVTGLPAPRWQVPRAFALGIGGLSQVVEGRILKREPAVALEAARMSTTNMMFNDRRARHELGHSPRPASEAIADSARWFAKGGYVTPKRLGRITLDTGS